MQELIDFYRPNYQFLNANSVRILPVIIRCQSVPYSTYLDTQQSIVLSYFHMSLSSHHTLISSAQNVNFKRWIALHESKGLKKYRQCLVLGKRIVQEILIQHTSHCQELLISSKSGDHPEVPHHLHTYRLADSLFQHLDVTGTASPILVCEFPQWPSVDLSLPPDGLEVLCPLGDPSNLGTLIRSCLAFDVRKLILLREAAHPFHPKAIRASSGMVFDQALYTGPSITGLLNPDISRWIVALDPEGKSLSHWNWPQNARLLVGEEGLGLPKGTYQQTLSIPQAKGLDSLNAATAMSIAPLCLPSTLSTVRSSQNKGEAAHDHTRTVSALQREGLSGLRVCKAYGNRGRACRVSSPVWRPRIVGET